MTQKEEYIKYIIENYQGQSQELLLKQIELFFNPQQIKKTKYNVGDNVILKKGTHIHGVPGIIDSLDWVVENGFIANDFTNHSQTNKIKSKKISNK